MPTLRSWCYHGRLRSELGYVLQDVQVTEDNSMAPILVKILNRIRSHLGTSEAPLLFSDEKEQLDNEITRMVDSLVQANACEQFDLFRQLGEVQNILATLSFKYHVELSPFQDVIVQKCDRLDDDHMRDLILREIKGERFFQRWP